MIHTKIITTNPVRLSLLVFVVFLLINEANAQWIVKNLNEDSFNTSTVKFKNDSLGLFMGDDSNILKTTDIGETWNSIQLDLSLNVIDFQFVGDSTIFAVGGSKLINSENLGENWNSISNFSGKHLKSVWFFNIDSGLVAGYDGIYRTINKGNTWDTVWSITQFGYKYGELKQFSFPTSEIGYAIGIGRTQHNNLLFDHFLLKTANSGISWDLIYTLPDVLTSIDFINQHKGFIGTESGILYQTKDGGDSWTELKLTNIGNEINSIQFISEMEGFVAGGVTLFTTNQGIITHFLISKTQDGGETWASYDTMGIPLNSIYFINDSIGFVSGDYELIMKTNGVIDKLPEDYPWHLVGGHNSIDENILSSSSLNIYPNPTSGTLFIQNLNSNEVINSISMVNTLGHTVYSLKPAFNNELIHLCISDLKSGMYFVKIVYTENIVMNKIIKK